VSVVVAGSETERFLSSSPSVSQFANKAGLSAVVLASLHAILATIRDGRFVTHDVAVFVLIRLVASAAAVTSLMLVMTVCYPITDRSFA
jgi:hypothetical protein